MIVFRTLLLLAAAPALVTLPVLADDVRLRLLLPGVEAPAPQNVVLDAVGVRDLHLDPAQAAGSLRSPAVSDAVGMLRLRAPALPLRTPELRIRRQLPLRWQLDIPTNLRVGQPQVRLELESGRGELGVLSAFDGGGYALAANARTEAGYTVARNDQRELREGEVWLEFDLAQARQAGRYAGRLWISVELL